MQKYKMWIAGKWVDAQSGKTYEPFNPATGEKIAQVPLGDKNDVALAVEAAKKAFPVWSEKSLDERAALFYRFAEAIRKHVGELVETEIMEHGTPVKSAQRLISSLSQMFEYTAQAGRAFMGQVIPYDWPALIYTRREPRGVCALIIPWNVPTAGAMVKMSAALATGNTCVLKPSSVSSLTTLMLGKILDEVGIPPGTVNILTGPGGSVGESLATHPDVRMVSFTGSSEVGKRLMSVCGGSVKRMQLELGGKNPFIVLKDANVDAAAARAVTTSFGNSGMVCTCPGRYYIHESIYDEFVAKFVAGAKNIVTGDPADEKTDMGPVVSAEHRDKVEEYIKIGIEEGAKLVLGGKRPTVPPLNKGFFVMPTVFTGVKQTMRIAREEIFGPVACFIKFSSEDEVLKWANDTEYGLVASVWTRNAAKGINMANKIQAGTVWVNDHQRGGIEIPHGGYKESGFGKEKSAMGMEEFTQVKVISLDLTE